MVKKCDDNTNEMNTTHLDERFIIVLRVRLLLFGVRSLLSGVLCVGGLECVVGLLDCCLWLGCLFA